MEEGPPQVWVKPFVHGLSHYDPHQGSVHCKFRVTLWWEAAELAVDGADDNGAGWAMVAGKRDRAGALANAGATVDVPPLSIMNAIDMSTEGAPQVTHLHGVRRGLMRWTCMYKTTLTLQDSSLFLYPFDSHEITIKYAITFGPFQDALVQPATEDQQQRAASQRRLPPFGHIEGACRLSGFLIGQFGVDAISEDLGRFGVVMEVHRRSQYFTATVIPQINLLLFLGCLAFVVPISHGSARMTMTMSTMFALAALRVSIDKILPKDQVVLLQHYLDNVFFSLSMVATSQAVNFALFEQLRGFRALHAHCVDAASAVVILANLVANSYRRLARVRRAHDLRCLPFLDQLSETGRPTFSDIDTAFFRRRSSRPLVPDASAPSQHSQYASRSESLDGDLMRALQRPGSAKPGGRPGDRSLSVSGKVGPAV